MKKDRRAAGFSLLSGLYDRLASLVFGSQIKLSQIGFIGDLHFCRRLLILGGGTGLVLREILLRCPVEQVSYVDIAPGMIEQARRRISENIPAKLSAVWFITGTVDDVPEGEKFDAVCTQFFLDVFGPESVRTVMDAIDARLKPGGYWIYADFSYEQGTAVKRVLAKFLIGFMYLFFRLLCGIEAGRLPDTKREFERLGYGVEKSRSYAGGLIQAYLLYKKPLASVR